MKRILYFYRYIPKRLSNRRSVPPPVCVTGTVWSFLGDGDAELGGALPRGKKASGWVLPGTHFLP